MINDYIPDDKLIEFIEMYEKLKERLNGRKRGNKS